MLTSLGGEQGHRLSVPWAAIVLLGYVVAAQPQAILRFRVRSHEMQVSLADLPLVVGLFTVPVWLLFVAAATGWALSLLTVHRPAVQQAFNGSMDVLNVAISVGLFALIGHTQILDRGSWAASFSAVVIGSAATSLGVLMVLHLVGARPGRTDAVWLLAAAVTMSVVNVTFGLVTLIVITAQSWGAVLLAVLAGVALFAYTGYTRLTADRQNIGRLYDFTQETGVATETGGLAHLVLDRTREFLRAEQATLWLPAADGFPELLLRTTANDDVVEMLSDEVPEQLRTAFERAPSSWWDAARQRTRKEPGRTAITAPLHSAGRVIGVLEVNGRVGEEATFGRDEARLLETLTAHAGVGVQNSRLLARLQHDARHDALTGLPNRQAFGQAVDAAIAAALQGEVLAILLLDLDSFKDVNDTLGHQAGDRLLHEVGSRIRTALPSDAVVARLGGDEFAVLMRVPDATQARAFGVTLRRALDEPVDIDGLTLDAGGSVGVAVYPEQAKDGKMLLQRAEVAMYTAKTSLRPVQSYAATMDSSSLRRLALVPELRRAIDEGQLTVFYQPKVNVSSQDLVGVEALVRWDHPDQGIIGPDDFVPVAEHTGMIGPLTEFVLRTSLRQCRQWQDEGRQLTVAVNISVRSLPDPDFADEVARLLEESGVAAEQLTLEITETSVMSDIDRALPTLLALRQLGVRLSVDDFGTGHSSLTYLRRLPVDEVKIDRTFVGDLATDSYDAAIVRTIVDLGRYLGLRVVAEGVENELSYSRLRQMGCDEVQGFLFTRPLPHDRLETWIRAHTETSPTVAGVRRLRAVGE